MLGIVLVLIIVFRPGGIVEGVKHFAGIVTGRRASRDGMPHVDPSTQAADDRRVRTTGRGAP